MSLVISKQTQSKTSKSPPRSTAEPLKSITLSSVERFNKWNTFEQKRRETKKQLFQGLQQDENLDIFTPSLIDGSDDNNKKFSTSTIAAVPSFSLRATAVRVLPPDNYILSERTQSIHPDISLFKFYQNQRQTKLSVRKQLLYLLSVEMKNARLVTIRKLLCFK